MEPRGPIFVTMISSMVSSKTILKFPTRSRFAVEPFSSVTTLASVSGVSADFGGRENGRPNHKAACPSLVLLAKDETGYRNLMALSSKAFLDIGPTDDPHVRMHDLAHHCAGLIALTGGPCGPVNMAFAARREDEAKARFEWLLQQFGDRLYVELQRHGDPGEAVAEPR